MFSDYYFFCRRRSKNIWSKAKHDTILLISYWHMFWYALYSHHTLNVMIHSCILWLVGSSKLAMNGAAEWNRKRVRKYWISSSNGKLHRKIWFDKIWWDWATDLSRFIHDGKRLLPEKFTNIWPHAISSNLSYYFMCGSGGGSGVQLIN